MKRLIGIVVACCVLAAILFIWSGEKNTLKSVVLTSPRNTAMYNKVDITIAKRRSRIRRIYGKGNRKVLSNQNLSG